MARIRLALLVVAAGVVCAVLVVYRLLDPPDLATAADTAATETGRRLGAVLRSGRHDRDHLGRVADDRGRGRGGRRPSPRSPRSSRSRSPSPSRSPSRSPSPSGPRARRYDRPAWPPSRTWWGSSSRSWRSCWDAPAAPRSEHSKIPAAPGVYLFTRNDEPVNVGQAPDLRRRLAEQCRPSSGHSKATLAFEIAKRAADREGVAVDGPPSRLATSDDFSPYFTRAKEAVAGLPVRFLEVESRELRALFEVYGSLALGTTESASDAP